MSSAENPCPCGRAKCIQWIRDKCIASFRPEKTQSIRVTIMTDAQSFKVFWDKDVQIKHFKGILRLWRKDYPLVLSEWHIKQFKNPWDKPRGLLGYRCHADLNASRNICVATYSRVSSHEQKQKGDLERQSGRILKYCVDKQYQVIESFEEVGSGMKDDRPKLKRLFKLVEGKKIDKVIVEHKDRLARFMVQFLIDYFASYDVEIEWMSEILGTTYEQELVEDILSLMSSFSNRIYGRRSAENRKARKLAEQAAKEIKSAAGIK